MKQWYVAGAGLLMLMQFSVGGCKSSSKIDQMLAEQERTQAQLDRMATTLNQLGSELRSFSARQNTAPGYSPPPASSFSAPPPPMPATTTISVTPAATTGPTASGLTNVQSVAVPSTQEQMRIRVPGEVLFGSGKASLDSSTQQLVDQWITIIRRDYPTSYIRVEGFSDADPIHKSDWNTNDQLSQQRADAVKAYMIKTGIDSSRIEAVGMGAVRQRSTKALSRRAELSLLVNR